MKLCTGSDLNGSMWLPGCCQSHFSDNISLVPALGPCLGLTDLGVLTGLSNSLHQVFSHISEVGAFSPPLSDVQLRGPTMGQSDSQVTCSFSRHLLYVTAQEMAVLLLGRQMQGPA